MLETCVGVWADRHFPITAIAERCKAHDASDAIDGILIPDQMAGFIPVQLWNGEHPSLLHSGTSVLGLGTASSRCSAVSGSRG